MPNYSDLSIITDAAYKLAKLIEGGHYSNIFYYEFHEDVDPSGIYNCLEGLESFREVTAKFEGIFISGYFVDEVPANIHVALKVGNELFIIHDCGANYYLGYGPSGIIELRKACFQQKVTGFIIEEDLDVWLANRYLDNSTKSEATAKFEHEKEEFVSFCKSLIFFAKDMQRRPDEYHGLKEENIRDRIIIPLNTVFEGRVHAESKNRNGKTDLLIRTKDGSNEHVLELKVWNGLNTLTGAISQIQSYLSWHNNYCGIVIFCFTKKFSSVLEKVHQYLEKEYESLAKLESNVFQFEMSHQTDEDRSIEVNLVLVNLYSPRKQ